MAHKDQNSSNDRPIDVLDHAKRIASQQLRSLQQAGVDVLPVPSGQHIFDLARESPVAKPQAASTNRPVAETPNVSNRAPVPLKETKTTTIAEATSSISNDKLKNYEVAPLKLEQRIERLAVLRSEVASCEKCSELVACRKNTVFGIGNPQPELCFVGEGPGADEDRLGEPFVGKAGQLLDKIIGACKMSREDIYILNTIKCRPPGNRNPNETELENCWPYAIQQLEILQPKFICCLGSVAARTLLGTTQSIGRMRGKFYNFRGSQVIVTYHPAYLLRNPSAKRQVWDDMKILMAAMGREI